MTQDAPTTRRALLTRMGLAAGLAYATPTLIGTGTARVRCQRAVGAGIGVAPGAPAAAPRACPSRDGRDPGAGPKPAAAAGGRL